MRYLPFIILMIVVMSCAITTTPNTVTPTIPAATISPPSTDVPVVATASPNDPGNRIVPPSPFDPQPGDEKLMRGNVFVTSAQLLQLESYPVQVRLSVKGSLPTPCHQLRARVTQSSALIQIEMYSLVSPNVACVQVIKEFTASIPLGHFSAAKYAVMLNGKSVGEISAP